MEALKRGYIQILVEAGCVITPPTCRPCVGAHMGLLTEGEVAIATSNKYFTSRMGHKNSRVYLASPTMAPTSAIEGKIAMDIINSGDTKIKWGLYVTRRPTLIELFNDYWILHSSGDLDGHSMQSIEIDNKRALYTFARLKLEKVASGKASVSVFVTWL